MISFDANREKINGDHSELSSPVDKTSEEFLAPKVNGDVIGEKVKDELFSNSTGSSSNSNLEVNPAPTKGYGLKKWRRITRDLNKDASEGVDSNMILKRRLSVPPKVRDDNRATNVVDGEPETPTPSVGSLRSVEAVEAVALDQELVQLVTAGGFSIGADSDNSEDRSSKSSTAASVPKQRHEIGFGRDRTRIKNVGGRGWGNSLYQRTQRGRGGVDVSKKIRGDQGRIEKNSPSSIESDLRSSNVRFMRWGSGASNGKYSEKSLNFDEEHGDEAQTCEEVRSGYYKENGVAEDLLRGDLDPDLVEDEKNVDRENSRPLSGVDPFVETVAMLQAAQEALETGILLFNVFIYDFCYLLVLFNTNMALPFWMIFVVLCPEKTLLSILCVQDQIQIKEKEANLN